MAHTTRTAEICALNISSKSWQAYFKVFSLHVLINMIVRDQHCHRRMDRKARASDDSSNGAERRLQLATHYSLSCRAEWSRRFEKGFDSQLPSITKRVLEPW